MITLGIIGVVAALTIPTVINKYKEIVTVTKVKKFYSLLSNAYMLSKIDNGAISDWGLSYDNSNNESSKFLRDNLVKYLKIIKTCDDTNEFESCGIVETFYSKKGSVDAASPSRNGLPTAAALLSDGSSLLFLYNGNDNIVYYDVNGIKPPNIAGEDWFNFYVYDNEVKPFAPSCKTSTGAFKCQSVGFCCTPHIIYEGNMDYLKDKK